MLHRISAPKGLIFCSKATRALYRFVLKGAGLCSIALLIHAVSVADE
jgi:hypothetical protein